MNGRSAILPRTGFGPVFTSRHTRSARASVALPCCCCCHKDGVIREGASEDAISRMIIPQRGFTTFELMVVIIITLIITIMTIPSAMSLARNYKIGGDTRGIAAQLNLARMRAAADYTHGRVYMNLTSNTYHLEIWNKSSSCWQTEGDTNSCTQTTSPVTLLSQGDTFGFGTITTGPANAGATSQAPACTSGVGGPSPGTTTSNTACIEFNSRGYPVNSANTIVSTDAVYLTNNNLYSAIAVSISGQPSSYTHSGTAWVSY